MNAEQAERLKRLQLEDLGTARRELISTKDTKKFRECLEDIEATRMSNKPGSKAHALAQKNEKELSGWANIHKEIGDTDDLENLDSLLDGQSHRMQLSAIVRNGGGQDYEISNRKNRTVSSSSMTRSEPMGRGRGGGVMGTRGRGSKQLSPHTHRSPPSSPSSRTSSQGAVMKLGRHIVTRPPARGQLLDPALDANNSGDPKQAGKNQFKNNEPLGGKNTHYKPENPVVKSRRPMAIPMNLSSPEDFLAAARGFTSRSSSAPTDTNNISTKVGPDTNQNRAQNTGKNGQAPLKKTTDSLPDRPNEDSISVASTRSEAESRAIHTPSSVNSSAIAAKSTLPQTPAISTPETNAYVTDDQDVLSEPMSLETPEKDTSSHQIIKKQTTTEESQAKGLSSTVPQSLPKDINTPKQTGEPQSAPETTGELLLDLGLTPPMKPIPDFALMSPGCEELLGIKFEQKSIDSVSTVVKPKEVKPSKANNAADEIQRQIDQLTDLLEKTSLSDPSFQALKECKEALELTRARLTVQGSTQSSNQTTGSKPEAAAQLKLSVTPGKVADDKPEQTKSVDESKTVQQEAKTPQAAEYTPTNQRAHGLTTPEESPSLRIRLQNAVSKPPFVPRASSFSSYRSSTTSNSSESTVLHSTADRQSHSNDSRESIIGDRNLPGQSGPSLIGDQNLPGRRNPSGSVSNADYLSLSRHRPNESNKGKVNFSIPIRAPSASLPVFKFNSSSNSPTGLRAQRVSSWQPPLPTNVEAISVYPPESNPKTETKNESPVAQTSLPISSSISAPAAIRKTLSNANSALGQSIYAPKVEAMQQSIHAPKESQENRIPTAKSTSSVFQGGLQSSRYAEPESYNPFR